MIAFRSTVPTQLLFQSFASARNACNYREHVPHWQITGSVKMDAACLKELIVPPYILPNTDSFLILYPLPRRPALTTAVVPLLTGFIMEPFSEPYTELEDNREKLPRFPWVARTGTAYSSSGSLTLKEHLTVLCWVFSREPLKRKQSKQTRKNMPVYFSQHIWSNGKPFDLKCAYKVNESQRLRETIQIVF